MNTINHNLMAANVANTLNSHYGKLATSVERLSSGLRINSAADDAAGLAIRELMRADVAALHQGVRNANDAISMIQVADGALAVIDEKLIRMKELAEQAATGTYDSTQRLMIDSEFQVMGAEIDRIANATDFNGVHLLDGSLNGAHDGGGLLSTGAMKIHFGTANDSAEDYYYVEIDDCSTAGLGLGNKLILTADAPRAVQWITEAKIDTVGRKIILDVPDAFAGDATAAFMDGLDFYQLPVGLENVIVTSNASTENPFHKPHVSMFLNSGLQITGVQAQHANFPTQFWDADIIDAQGNISTTSQRVSYWWNRKTGDDVVAEGISQGVFLPTATFGFGSDVRAAQRPGAFNTYLPNGPNEFHLRSITGINEIGSAISNYRGSPTDEIYEIDKITSDLVFFIGGHNNPDDGCNRYKLRIEADITETFLQQLKVWSGQETLDEYYGDMVDIKTQEKAQKALERIDDAIVAKDKVRAHLGALQNRLENTVTNLTVQAENLQTAESRISDTDVATEMTIFVRNQVLTQSAVAMLGQANSYPHMLSGLIIG